MRVFCISSAATDSHNGIHIFCHGETELKGDVVLMHEGPVEIFSESRIITLTGNLINPDYNGIEDGEDALQTLEAMVKPKARPKLQFGLHIDQSNPTASLSPEQEISKLENAL